MRTDAARQAHWLVRAADRSACEVVRALPGVESLEIETPEPRGNLRRLHAGAPAGTDATAGGSRGVIAIVGTGDRGGVYAHVRTVMVEGCAAVLADLAGGAAARPGPRNG